jgi:hypothetical protein
VSAERPATKTARLSGRVVALRKQNLSVYHLSAALKESGESLSPPAIWTILHDEGFARLPRRGDDERARRVGVTPGAPADVREVDFAPRELRAEVGGLFLNIVPMLAEIGFDASSCRPPGRSACARSWRPRSSNAQRADAAQRELLSRRVAKAEAQRRKLLDAYYAGAIDITTLKSEQARIGADIQVAKDRLGDLDANLGEQQEILELAATFAARCGDAYAKASDRTRKLFNAAVFERLDVKGGRLCHEQYRPPFDGVFTVSEFEHGTRVACSHGQATWGNVRSQQGSPRDYSRTFHSPQVRKVMERRTWAHTT